MASRYRNTLHHTARRLGEGHRSDIMSRLPNHWNSTFAQYCGYSRHYANQLRREGKPGSGSSVRGNRGLIHDAVQSGDYFLPLDGRARTNSLASTSSASAI
jgi:hypothetical protein